MSHMSIAVIASSFFVDAYVVFAPPNHICGRNVFKEGKNIVEDDVCSSGTVRGVKNSWLSLVAKGKVLKRVLNQFPGTIEMF